MIYVFLFQLCGLCLVLLPSSVIRHGSCSSRTRRSSVVLQPGQTFSHSTTSGSSESAKSEIRRTKRTRPYVKISRLLFHGVAMIWFRHAYLMIWERDGIRRRLVAGVKQVTTKPGQRVQNVLLSHVLKNRCLFGECMSTGDDVAAAMQSHLVSASIMRPCDKKRQ
ncbi:hypothetical protein EDB19DRAFT_1753362 [Suillus lakei]|nr:hypothetical protein EDB19DRAFT_1753362 [Suillus lakei]